MIAVHFYIDACAYFYLPIYIYYSIGLSDAVDKSDVISQFYGANLIDISFKFKYFIFVKKSQKCS